MPTKRYRCPPSRVTSPPRRARLSPRAASARLTGTGPAVHALKASQSSGWASSNWSFIGRGLTMFTLRRGSHLHLPPFCDRPPAMQDRRDAPPIIWE